MTPITLMTVMTAMTPMTLPEIEAESHNIGAKSHSRVITLKMRITK